MVANNMLTTEQREAVLDPAKACIVTAGAGSGKTTLLVERYLKTLQLASPNEILTLTFTKEAALQLKKRILIRAEETELSDKIKNSIEHTNSIGTIHSFCFSVIKNHLSAISTYPIHSVIEEPIFQQYFEKYYNACILKLEPDTLHSLLKRWNLIELRELAHLLYLKRDEAVLKPFELYQIFSPYFEELEKNLLKLGFFTFNDLEVYALRILKNESVQKEVQKQYKFLLLDEFQDTSRIQWEILEHVLSNNRQKLFIVGDPKQSIYRFRNAEVDLFLKLEKSIPEEGGKAVTLTTNFRSEENLLTTINAISSVIFSNSDILFTPMKAVKLERGLFEFITYENDIANEVECAVSKIKELNNYSETCVLFRFSDKVKDFEIALKNEGIPFTSFTQHRLFDYNDIWGIYGFIGVILHPEEAYYRALFERSSWYAPFELPLEESSAEEALDILFLNTPYWPQKNFLLKLFENIDPKASLTHWFETLTLLKNEEISFQETSSQQKGVQLLTIHRSKGLEFKHVLLVDNLRITQQKHPLFIANTEKYGYLARNENQKLPHEAYLSLLEEQKKKDLEESLRILYVAITRAKESLTCFLPKEGNIPKNSFGHILKEFNVQKT